MPPQANQLPDHVGLAYDEYSRVAMAQKTDKPNGAAPPGKMKNVAFASTDTLSARLAMPYGVSLLGKLISHDETSHGRARVVSWMYLVGTVVMMAVLPVLPVVLAPIAEGGNYAGINLYTKWDEDHGVVSSSRQDGFRLNELFASIVQLLETTLGLTRGEITAILLYVTLLPVFLLALFDTLNPLLPASCSVDWPRGWDTANTVCYFDMFCEPTRVYGNNGKFCLVRRPGNTYSNTLYLFGSGCILCSTWKLSSLPSGDMESTDMYWIPDMIYGVMLMCLAISSFTWHACNPTMCHYIDLWSTDSCIVYLPIRVVFVGGAALLSRLGVVDGGNAAHKLGAIGCALAYAVFVATCGYVQTFRHNRGFLHGGFPLSARHRLQTGGYASIPLLCLFVGVPILALSLCHIVNGFIHHSVGSLLASTLASTTFVLGWGPRVFERFLLDGWPPMKRIRQWQYRLRMLSSDDAKKGSGNFNPTNHRMSLPKRVAYFILTTAGAFASPTAGLHFFTSITLLMGYVHCKSIQL